MIALKCGVSDEIAAEPVTIYQEKENDRRNLSQQCRFMTAFADGNVAAVGELYTDNARLMPPNSDTVSGRDGIVAALQSFIDMGIASIKLETVEAEEHGDTAIEEGRYTLGTADGQTADVGKYIVIWKNDNGTWKLHKDIFNSNQPAE